MRCFMGSLLAPAWRNRIVGPAHYGILNPVSFVKNA